MTRVRGELSWSPRWFFLSFVLYTNVFMSNKCAIRQGHRTCIPLWASKHVGRQACRLTGIQAQRRWCIRFRFRENTTHKNETNPCCNDWLKDWLTCDDEAWDCPLDDTKKSKRLPWWWIVLAGLLLIIMSTQQQWGGDGFGRRLATHYQ